jgi:hypothetical protein
MNIDFTYENTFIIDNNVFRGYPNRIDDIVVAKTGSGNSNGWIITSAKKIKNNLKSFRHINFGCRAENLAVAARMWDGGMTFQDLEYYYEGKMTLEDILKF